MCSCLNIEKFEFSLKIWANFLIFNKLRINLKKKNYIFGETFTRPLHFVLSSPLALIFRSRRHKINKNVSFPSGEIK